MIRQVNIYNDLGEVLNLELASPEKSGLVITNIEGIGPEYANININDSSNMDGGTYNSAKRPSRNIVFSLRFMDYPSVEDNRHVTYRYFPLKKQIKMEFITDTREAYIYGRVESNTPNIFSNEEGCQISVLCPDPNFYKIFGNEEYETVSFSDGIPMFEFPFIKNDKILEDSRPDSFIFRDVYLTDGYAKVMNESDDDIGCIFCFSKFLMNSNYDISIKNLTTNKEMILNLSTSTYWNNILFIKSFDGDKEIYAYNLYSNGTIDYDNKFNKINSKIPDSDWIYLKRGENLLQFTITDGNSNEYWPQIAEVQYPTIYGGI